MDNLLSLGKRLAKADAAPASFAKDGGMLRGIDRYEITDQIGEGTYGKVFRGKDRVTGQRVALKRMTPHHEGEGFPRTETREIKTLMSITDVNMVRLLEVVTSLGSAVDGGLGKQSSSAAAGGAADGTASSSGAKAAGGPASSVDGGPPLGSAVQPSGTTGPATATAPAAATGAAGDGKDAAAVAAAKVMGQTERSGNIFMVFEYVDYDLAGLIEGGYRFKDAHTKSITFQLLKTLEKLHRRDIVHRDLKCANILLSDDCRVKLGDFGELLLRMLSFGCRVSGSHTVAYR